MDLRLTVIVALLLIGFAIGMVSGLVGIGGGVLIIPVLIFLFGFSQAQANGTSLAIMLPPVGLLAVLTYWRAGNVEWRYAALLAAGFAAGAYVGAVLLVSGRINPTALRVGFALLLVYCAGRLLFRSGGRAGAALQTSLLVAGFAATYLAFRWAGSRWERKHSAWARVYRAKLGRHEDHDYEI